MSTPNSVRTEITLPILLGELTLRRAAFSGLRLTHDIFEGTSDSPFPLEVLADLGRDIDIVHLASWPVVGNVRLPKVRGLHCYVSRRYRRFFIDMRMPFSAYMEKFSSKSRSTLNRKLRKFTQACGGFLECVEYAKQCDILRFHDLAREVSRVTYQETLLQSGIPDGESFRDQLIELARQDRVRGYILFHRGQPAAYLYCPVSEGIVQYEYVGFDPQYSTLSPGTVLFFVAIQRLFNEGKFRAFDFTEGEGEHKHFFANCHVDCADIYYMRHTAHAHAIVLSHALCRFTSQFAGTCLAHLGIKRALIRLIRRTCVKKQVNRLDA